MCQVRELDGELLTGVFRNLVPETGHMSCPNSSLFSVFSFFSAIVVGAVKSLGKQLSFGSVLNLRVGQLSTSKLAEFRRADYICCWLRLHPTVKSAKPWNSGQRSWESPLRRCSLALEEPAVSFGAFSENLTAAQNSFLLSLVGVKNVSSSQSHRGIVT